jgi:hypothetical protein
VASTIAIQAINVPSIKVHIRMTNDIKDAKEIISLCTMALRRHHIGPRDARLLTNCADAHKIIAELRTKQFKKGRSNLFRLPELGLMRDLLKQGQYSAAIMEARQIRSAIAPILKLVKRYK